MPPLKWNRKLIWIIPGVLHLLISLICLVALREDLAMNGCDVQGVSGTFLKLFLGFPYNMMSVFPPYPLEMLGWVIVQSAVVGLWISWALSPGKPARWRVLAAIWKFVQVVVSLWILLMIVTFSLMFNTRGAMVTSERLETVERKVALLRHFIDIPGDVYAAEYRMGMGMGYRMPSYYFIAVRVPPAEIDRWLQIGHGTFLPNTSEEGSIEQLFEYRWDFVKTPAWRRTSVPEYFSDGGNWGSYVIMYRREGMVFIFINKPY